MRKIDQRLLSMIVMYYKDGWKFGFPLEETVNKLFTFAFDLLVDDIQERTENLKRSGLHDLL